MYSNSATVMSASAQNTPPTLIPAFTAVLRVVGCGDAVSIGVDGETGPRVVGCCDTIVCDIGLGPVLRPV